MNYGEAYRQLHERNPKWFPGYTLKRYVSDVAELVHQIEPRNILDFGCGKGYQYLGMRVHEQWGGLLPHCYDPGVRQLDVKPEGKFDGLICTDVLEHIEAGDVAAFLDEALGYIGDDEERLRFAFFSISCRPSEHKNLPDGRNVHLTVRGPEWWMGQLNKALSRGPIWAGVAVRVAFETETVIRREVLR